MFYYKSHKIKLYPTKEQEVFFLKSCGVSRFSYNRWKELYEKGDKGNLELDRDLNAAINLKQYFITTTQKSWESNSSGVPLIIIKVVRR